MAKTNSSVADATTASPAASATSVQLFAANGRATMRTVYNEGSTALYLKFGTTASVTSYTVQVPTLTYYEFPLPVYTGRVDGIWAGSPTGNARTTEY